MQHFLSISLVFISVVLASSTFIAGKDSSKTLSRHIATNKIFKVSFALVCILAVAFSSLTLFSFIPGKIQINLLYYFFLIGILACVVLLAIFPDTKGISAKIHQISAWTMAYLMLPFVMNIYFLQNNILSLISIFLMIILQTKLQLSKTKILYFQVSYILIFVINLLYLIYFS